jgi:PAS domain-containing protein
MLESGSKAGKKGPAGNRWPQILLEISSDPAMLFTADGRLLDGNSAAVDMMEAESVEEMRGRPLEAFVAAEDNAAAAEATKLLASGGSGELQWGVVGKKGSRRKFNFCITPLPRLRGTPPA